jgi:hypothetical protein
MISRLTTCTRFPLVYALGAIAIAGWISGNHLYQYLLAALAFLCMRWSVFFRTHRTATYAFTFDPDAPRAQPFLQALHDLLQIALKKQRPFRIRLHHFRSASSRYTPTLELFQNDLVMTHCVERKARLNHPGIWIAEHPIPLPLPAQQALTLHVSPTRDHRVRVATETHGLAYASSHVLPLIAAMAIACLLDCNSLLAITLGMLFACLLK